MKLTENEKKHLVNTIVKQLPKQGEDFSYQTINVRGASGFETMGLQAPRFGTVGAGSTITLDRPPEIIGQKKVPLTRGTFSKTHTYSPKRFFVYMRKESFDSLLSELTSDELEVFDSCRGCSMLWYWDGFKFYSRTPKTITETLTDKIIIHTVSIVHKKDKALN